MAVGAPNQCRDGRKTMCAIILTQDLGLIRIYPIPASEKFSVWSFVDIDIERSQSDTRHESYKVTSYKVGNIIDDKEEKRRILNRCIIRSGTVDPLQFQNDNLSSIAMVKLPFGTLEFTLSQRIPETRRDDEEHPWILTQAAHWAKPYLSWISEQGTQHKTHLVGREVYMGLQHNADNPWNLFNNLQVNNPDYECWMLLGNMKDRRNVWVAPHIHRLKKTHPILLSPASRSSMENQKIGHTRFKRLEMWQLSKTSYSCSPPSLSRRPITLGLRRP